jgi:hypothetical protein
MKHWIAPALSSFTLADKISRNQTIWAQSEHTFQPISIHTSGYSLTRPNYSPLGHREQIELQLHGGGGRGTSMWLLAYWQSAKSAIEYLDLLPQRQLALEALRCEYLLPSYIFLWYGRSFKETKNIYVWMRWNFDGSIGSCRSQPS